MKSEDAKDFAVRLRSALQDVGVRASPTVVANIFNQKYWGKSITSHTARSWLVGTSIPMQDKLVVLSEWLKINPQELRFGLSKVDTELQFGCKAQPIIDLLNMQDREMLHRYLQLPPSTRAMVREVVDAFATANDFRKAPK